MKKVLVFELNNYHTEVFPIYENLLPSLLNDSVELEYFVYGSKEKDIKKMYPKTEAICSSITTFALKQFYLRVPFFVYKINKIIKQKNPDIVIFNSIEPERNYKIFKAIKAQKKIAVIHNPKSKTYKNMPKEQNEHFFVLSNIVYEIYKDKIPLDGYFLPFFKAHDIKKIENLGVTTIGVQGLLNYKKRDYIHLLDIAKELKRRNEKSIVFNIIGGIKTKDGIKFTNSVKESGLQELFVFHSHLNDYEFAQELSRCDFLITLLTEKYSFYYQDKTSASFSHSAAYKIPMILSKENAKAWGVLESEAVIYSDINDLLAKFMGCDREMMRNVFARKIDGLIEENKKSLVDI